MPERNAFRKGPGSLASAAGKVTRRLRGSTAWRTLADAPVVARLLRRVMFRTTVIAITGSVGKTTTKEALAMVLSGRGPTLKTRNNYNGRLGATAVLRRLRPRHRYAVIEVGTARPGSIRRAARVVRPDVAIVLGVSRQHTQSFPDLDATAREKASLLEYLAGNGVAVLNGDDERVRTMTPPAGTRTILFGVDPGADVRVRSATGAWPDRLSVEVEADGRRATVHTQLVGNHWSSAVVAAIAAARELGVPIEESAEALRGLTPFNARLQPITLPNGAVVVRDEYNGTADTVDPMLEVMRQARAERRVLVFSDVSNSRQRIRKRMRVMGQQAAEHTGLAVFIGSNAHHAVRSAIEAGMDPASCHDVIDARSAADVLRQELRAGDLVFLKGRMSDHLSRVLFAQFGSIGCWIPRCGVRDPCEFCPRLKPSYDLRQVIGDRTEGIRPPATSPGGTP